MTKISSCNLTDSDPDCYLHGIIKRPSLMKPMTMLNSKKYRMKEERKKVLKLSVHKLKEIEDPEVFLRRSVLINNTMKRLQTEVKEDTSVKRDFYTRRLADFEDESMTSSSSSSSSEDEEELPSSNTKRMEEDESDLLLGEVYLPPPPPIEEEETRPTPPKNPPPGFDDDLNQDISNWFNEEAASAASSVIESLTSSYTVSSCPLTPETSTTNSIATVNPTTATNFNSCGQSSLFGELQSVVFNSLIASLET